MDNCYIPSVDAKDVYLATHYFQNDSPEFTFKLKNGQYNLRKFINSFDFSLDLIELYDIYFRKYRRHDFSFKIKHHLYTTKIVNLTFKYSVKVWNQMNKNTFVKFGYDYRNLVFDDCVARNSDNEIVGIKLNEQVKCKIHDLPNIFKCIRVDKKNKNENTTHNEWHYVKVGEPKTLKTNAELRKDLYKHGFMCDGVHYQRMKRSSGSSRVGKCLFIDDSFFKAIFSFSSKGLEITEGQEIDLAGFESYISLPSSSIIGTLPISAENILIIDDFDSVFHEDVIKTYNENGSLFTKEENCEIRNSIWDGQSLMDISLFGEYSQYGMVLLRNLMFKSCAFNCNIQQWFKDNNITNISQLNGYTRAKKIEDWSGII